MSTTLAAQAGRTADRIALVSGVLHLGVAVFGVWLAQREDEGAADWILAGFAALGLAATLLGWASVKAGRAVWTAGVVVLAISLAVLVWAVASDSALAVLSIAIPLLFIDYLLFSNAQRALNRP